MRSSSPKIHLEIQRYAKGPVGLLRSSYREDGKVKHKQFGRIEGKTLDELKLIQLSLRGKAIPEDDPNALCITQSKEHGASAAILAMIKATGLDKAIYSRPAPWVKDVMAMIAGRIIYSGSKLSLCNEYANTTLWQQCGVEGRPDVEKHCYEPLDKLLGRQEAIQKTLAKKHLKDGHLVLYDITSSYLEGAYQDSEVVRFGYNRDGKKGHQQVVIGLLCNKEGCPVGVELYPGNTKDESTVIEKVKEVKERYEISEVIFVGDRGMVTRSNVEALKGEEDIKTITALSRPEIKQLLTRDVIQMSLFDERHIHEVIDPDTPSKRYCLCRNPISADRDKQTRQALLNKVEEGMQTIAGYVRKTTVEVLGARVGKLFAKYKLEKIVSWEVIADKDNAVSHKHQLVWSIDEEKLAQEERFDGCYIITTDVPQEQMQAQEVVASYKRLSLVEQAFRNLKTVQLEMRPIYHKKDDRIRAHVFLCMLAYYIQWHMTQSLKPLFESDGKGKERRWSFAAVIHTLRQITSNTVRVAGTTATKIAKPTQEQDAILNLLRVAV